MPPAPVWVPSQTPLAPSVTSVTSVTNDKGDNEMIPGAVHRSPGICPTAEENHGNNGGSSINKVNKFLAHSYQGSHTSQLDFYNRLVDGSMTG